MSQQNQNPERRVKRKIALPDYLWRLIGDDPAMVISKAVERASSVSAGEWNDLCQRHWDALKRCRVVRSIECRLPVSVFQRLDDIASDADAIDALTETFHYGRLRSTWIPSNMVTDTGYFIPVERAKRMGALEIALIDYLDVKEIPES